MLIQQRMSQVATATQRVDQRMVMANAVLQMSSLELQEKIEQELLENPALELVPVATCPRCHANLLDGACPLCSDIRHRGQDPEMPLAWLDIKHGAYLSDGVYMDDEREEDPIARVQAEVSLSEHLRGQLRAIIPSSEVAIGEYLVGNLNEEGYLECDLGEAAARLGVSEPIVQAVLSALQSLDPPGVGARDLQECLLIQLRLLAEEGREVSLPRELVEKCWHELVQHSYDRIARRLRVSETQIQEAVRFIRDHLNPYPGRSFLLPWSGRCEQGRMIIRPDVIIHQGSDGFEVEVVESDRLLLKISDDYRRLMQEYASRRGRESEQVRAHIAQYFSRAQLLIRSIGQRRKTLQAITQCLIDHQTAFVSSGSPGDLVPLTRARVAARIGMHESTVSRATSGKFAQLPTGETIPFDEFFQGSLPVKERIRAYISEEDPAHPLTDLQIADMLWQRDGIRVARRTVLKYREQMRILSSAQRRGVAGGNRFHVADTL